MPCRQVRMSFLSVVTVGKSVMRLQWIDHSKRARTGVIRGNRQICVASRAFQILKWKYAVTDFDLNV